jgi:hypothetical protein
MNNPPKLECRCPRCDLPFDVHELYRYCVDTSPQFRKEYAAWKKSQPPKKTGRPVVQRVEPPGGPTMKGEWLHMETFDHVGYWLNRAWRRDLSRLAVWNGKDWQYCDMPKRYEPLIESNDLMGEQVWALMADCKRTRKRTLTKK